ncbi:GTP 3',8-cyclase MoaA [Curvibacter sp. CHRR-16]|uniref:GTP 3',8-cyclase MoaA n=1 Tax=Curvibacter sp. CHRR-16 TaxID=2835872 RepID=UPI001BDA291B|nr:GTP 3',8-cyclase MoaA [Curvibacter sp. CHRR-16]MBT0568766.1 GTP 3',8-cyclase MoaA [Curvibacter sp. CHRR-16]
MPSTLQPFLPLLDTLNRPLHDLRISVTDRCNFRCAYCMPKAVFGKDYPYLPHSALLSFEEITRLARQFVALGVRKIRLTGGEPLLRKNIERLVEQLAMLRTPDGHPLDLALTTNGSLLTQKARALKDAGLTRITVSLDSLDDATFRRMNDMDFPVHSVLEGIATAQSAGFGRIKINMVVQRGVNDHEVLPMARYFHGHNVALRFIEYMDVGSTNGWQAKQVVPSEQLLAQLQQHFHLTELPRQSGETATRWGYCRTNSTGADPSLGELGFISSVSQAFCRSCTRARLSTEGQLYLCLFAHQGHDLRSLLRNGVDDTTLQTRIATIWQQRQDRYSELRSLGQIPNTVVDQPLRRIEMSYIGG